MYIKVQMRMLYTVNALYFVSIIICGFPHER